MNNKSNIEDISRIDDIDPISIDDIKNINIDVIHEYSKKIIGKMLEFLPTIVIAMIIFIIGLFIIKYIEKIIKSFFKKTKFDEGLENFIQSFVVIILKLILFVIVVGMLGVRTSSFMAVFGAMVFAIGMALQGSLSNFAGGILILFFKPFKLRDFIESDGQSGSVVDIQIFNTILETADGRRVILPNAKVSNNTIINHSSINIRRLDFVIGIDYSDSIDKAKSLLKKIVNEEIMILKNKEILIVISELGDSSVNILVRVWTKNNNYWITKYSLLEKIKKEFDRERISFPFPQRDIHIYNSEKK